MPGPYQTLESENASLPVLQPSRNPQPAAAGTVPPRNSLGLTVVLAQEPSRFLRCWGGMDEEHPGPCLALSIPKTSWRRSWAF